MNGQRTLGLLLIGVQAAALGYPAKTVFVPVAVCLVALLASLTRWRVAMTRERGLMIAAAVLMAFLIRYRLAPPKLPLDALFMRTPLAHTLAQYFLTVQALLFFVRSKGDRLPLFLPGLGVVAMICAANVQIDQTQRTVFQALTAGFVVLSALYFGAWRQRLPSGARSPRARRVLSAAVLLVVAGAGVAGATLLYRYERSLEALVARILEPTAAQALGFSGEASLGRLSEHKLINSDQVALRISCDQQPGYLRGKAFGRLESHGWEALPGNRIIRPRGDAPVGLVRVAEDEALFGLRDVQSREWLSLRCWPSASLAGVAFAPMGSTHLESNTDYITTDVHGTFNTQELPPTAPYTVYRPGEPYIEELTESRLQRLTDVPRRLEWRFRRLADSVFAGCRTASEKIAAVERYFHENYEYHLGIEINEEEDPLVYFLSEKPPAHCEFFASGAAVLLRLGGVPCRYVSGFVVNERNPYGEYWVARNRDAHAWVEAYDDERGWVIVEATPAEGVPAAETVSGARLAWESLRDRLMMAWTSVRHKGLVLLAEWIAPWLIAGCVALVTLGVSLLSVRRIRRVPKRSAEFARDPRHAELHRLLDGMDARLRRLGVARRPGETLHQFAERLAAEGAAARDGGSLQRAAQWYRRYADARYGGVEETVAVAELDREADRWKLQRRSPSAQSAGV